MRGFTLVELVIVLALVAILLLIAIPTYHQYLAKARRTDGIHALLALSIQLEKHFAMHNSYGNFNGHQIDPLEKPSSPENWYQLGFQHLSNNSYTLIAEPLGQQAKHDHGCGALTLDHLGRKGATGQNKNCW